MIIMGIITLATKYHLNLNKVCMNNFNLLKISNSFLTGAMVVILDESIVGCCFSFLEKNAAIFSLFPYINISRIVNITNKIKYNPYSEKRIPVPLKKSIPTSALGAVLLAGGVSISTTGSSMIGVVTWTSSGGVGKVGSLFFTQLPSTIVYPCAQLPPAPEVPPPYVPASVEVPLEEEELDSLTTLKLVLIVLFKLFDESLAMNVTLYVPVKFGAVKVVLYKFADL